MTETDRQEYKEKIDKMIETIDYRSLIHIITELMNRIDKLEQRLDKQEEYQQEQNEN
jgi:hypothetical protein